MSERPGHAVRNGTWCTAVAVLVLAACGGGGPPVTDAEVAAAVCAPILEYRNGVARTLADAQEEVRGDGTSPREAFLAAFRDLLADTKELGEMFVDLELDRSDPGRRALDEQLVAGVEVAETAWSDLIGEFEAIPDPDRESINSRLASAFVGSEKPVEEVKPEVHDDLDDSELEAAFQDEPVCSFTTLR